MPNELFIASSAHCALYKENDVFFFHDPADPQSRARGTWQDIVNLAIKILAHEARTNGGIPGMIFSAAEHYAQGIEQGAIPTHDEDFGQQVVELIAQLKAQ